MAGTAHRPVEVVSTVVEIERWRWWHHGPWAYKGIEVRDASTGDLIGVTQAFGLGRLGSVEHMGHDLACAVLDFDWNDVVVVAQPDSPAAPRSPAGSAE